MTDDVAHFCSSCGAPLESDAHFCMACGHQVAGTGDTAAQPSTTAPTQPAPTTPTPAPVATPQPAPAVMAPVGGPFVATRSRTGGRTAAMVVIGVVAAIALIAGLVAVFIATRPDTASADEVVLEPVGMTTQNAFTDSVSGTERTPNPGAVKVPPPQGAQSNAGQQVNGAAAGLYGGSGNAAVCEPEKLIAFLQANPDKGRAWAGVLGIDPASIPTYVRSLTPVLLTRDTRVTNHGYANGRATTIPAVLQAGTAVMVDKYGVPRVKCGCGNPLTEPAPVTTKTTYRGNRWTGFSPTLVVQVSVTVQVNVFVVVDVSTGALSNRPVGTNGTGDTPMTPEEACAAIPNDPICGSTTTTSTTTTTTLPPTTLATLPPTTATTVHPTVPPTAPPTTDIPDRGVEPFDVVVQAVAACGRGGQLTHLSTVQIGPATYHVNVRVTTELGWIETMYHVDMSTATPTVQGSNSDADFFICRSNVPPDL